MPWLIPLIPAIIGAGGGVASSLIGRSGGGSSAAGGGAPGLDQRAGLENQALEQLLSQLGGLRGQAGQIRGSEQDLLDTLGVLFDFSGLPGLTGEESEFFSQGVAPFEGQQSILPAQNEFERLSSLLAPLLGATGSGATAGQSAALEQARRSELANSLGGAAGNVSQFLGNRNLLQILQELMQQGGGGGSVDPRFGQGFPLGPPEAEFPIFSLPGSAPPLPGR